MASSRKTPINNSAATLGDVHPSPAMWVVIEGFPDGKYRVVGFGRFLTEFHATDTACGRELTASFRPIYRSTYNPWRHVRIWSAGDLGLIPIETGEDELSPYSLRVEDPKEAGTFWSNCFIVKAQHAPKALGVTSDEFQEQYLEPYVGRWRDGRVGTFPLRCF